jgi:hypothetical protein
MLTPALGRAQIAIVSSAVEEKEAIKGEVYTGRIVIYNGAATAQAIRVSQSDYAGSAEGTARSDDPGVMPRSNVAWVGVQTQRVTVPPKSDVTVRYTVAVPQNDSLRGTYWSAIVVEAAEATPGATTGRASQPPIRTDSVTRYPVQVVTHIAATGTRTVRFDNPRASQDSTGAAAFDLDVVMTGDRAVRPRISVELYDAQGTLKAKEKQDRGLVYPGAVFHQRFDFGKLPPGTYKAVIVADTGAERLYASHFTIVF